MTQVRKVFPTLVVLAALAVGITLTAAPQDADAADHLDAPGLMSPGGDARLDINDLYAFEGSNPSNTVLAMTVNPVATGDTTFANLRNGSYHFRVDSNGDGKADLKYSAVFIDRGQSGKPQIALVFRSKGRLAHSSGYFGKLVGFGSIDKPIRLSGGGKFWAGLRSDPFFFDLGAFLGSVEGIGDRAFNDGQEADFFDGLNTLAIVLEVPDQKLGKEIGVWATTSAKKGIRSHQVDRMGRPAINTVVNSSGPLIGAPTEAKNVFNIGRPVNDQADFTDAVVAALQVYSSLDPVEGSYTSEQAVALAAALLPDILTYDTATSAAGPLNGRLLADDVIDIELALITGGDVLGVFADRDGTGGINTDGVGPHDDYLDVFPYLGPPHS